MFLVLITEFIGILNKLLLFSVIDFQQFLTLFMMGYNDG